VKTAPAHACRSTVSHRAGEVPTKSLPVFVTDIDQLGLWPLISH
jgi:hypothetical protein